MKRRDFLKYSGISGLAATAALTTQPSILQASTAKKILFLGGTHFIGPVIIKRLLEAGHEVTLFNRGVTQPHLFPGLEKLHGDRYPHKDKGLAALKNNREWDVVIDTWQGNPLCVQETAQLLQDRCQQYIYISTIAVYGRDNFMSTAGLTEDATIPQEPIPDSYTVDWSYTRRKRSSEQLAQAVLKDQLTIFRPHSICGYHLDAESDNQRYWPIRLQRGGFISAPGDGKDTTQYIDVDDLALFTVNAITRQLTGIYNTFTTETMTAYLYGLKALSTRPSQLIFMSHAFLAKNDVRYFSDMPMWTPRHEVPGFFSICNRKALNSGLSIKPLADTFKTVIRGFNETEAPDYQFGTPHSTSGLTSTKESELISSWAKLNGHKPWFDKAICPNQFS